MKVILIENGDVILVAGGVRLDIEVGEKLYFPVAFQYIGRVSANFVITDNRSTTL